MVKSESRSPLAFILMLPLIPVNNGRILIVIVSNFTVSCSLSLNVCMYTPRHALGIVGYTVKCVYRPDIYNGAMNALKARLEISVVTSRSFL